MFVVHIK